MERIVTLVIDSLNAAGLHAVHGYHGQELPLLDSPMVAVSLADTCAYPLCADGVIVQDAQQTMSGLRLSAELLLEVYNDYRKGGPPCSETAIAACNICSSLSEDFTCGTIRIGSLSYEADYDCFCCKAYLPVEVYMAETLSL